MHFFFMSNLSILCLLIVCKYHIRSPEAKLQNTSTLTCTCVAYLNNVKVPDVLCLVLYKVYKAL